MFVYNVSEEEFVGPVDVIHIIKHISCLKRDDTHRLTEGLFIKVLITTAFNFTLFRRRYMAFNYNGNNVIPIADATRDVGDIK